MRRVLAAEHERLLMFMTAQAFETEIDLAHAAVAFVVHAYQGMAKNSRYDESSHRSGITSISVTTCCGRSPRRSTPRWSGGGDPCAGIDVMQLAAGLTAVAAVAKSLFLRDITLLRQPGPGS